MQTITKKEAEDRKTYLVRVAIVFLEANAYTMEEPTMIFDGEECDALCLADDLKNEFNIT